MVTLETDRLILRPFVESDLRQFYEYARTPNIGPDAGWPPHREIDESRRILTGFIEDKEVWALVLKEENRLVGSLGLHADKLRTAPDVKMLGYVLSEDYWGRGLMTEAATAAIRYAFEHMDIKLLSVHHYSHNVRSKRVIEKCGFQYEGTLRRCTQLFNGCIYDLCCYSMTKEEWLKMISK